MRRTLRIGGRCLAIVLAMAAIVLMIRSCADAVAKNVSSHRQARPPLMTGFPCDELVVSVTWVTEPLGQGRFWALSHDANMNYSLRPLSDADESPSSATFDCGLIHR